MNKEYSMSNGLTLQANSGYSKIMPELNGGDVSSKPGGNAEPQVQNKFAEVDVSDPGSREMLRSIAEAQELAGLSEQDRLDAIERLTQGMPVGERPPRMPETARGQELDPHGIVEGRQEPDEQESFVRSVRDLLNNPEIRIQLESDTPDFSQLPELKDFIEGLNPSERNIILFADIISRNPGISMVSKKLIFEWTVENIVGLPEKGSHESRYELDIYTQGNLTKLKALSYNNFPEDREFARYIGELAEVRHMAHELRRNLTQGDNYKKFIQEGLKAHGLDFMRNGIAGASEVISLYETFSSLKTAQKKEWFNNGDIDDIRKNVQTVVRDLARRGGLQQNGRALTDWEVERALSIGDTFFAGTQRFAMYSSIGSLPPGTADRVGSLPYEFIVRNIASFKVTAVRFFYGGGSREFLKKIIGRLKASESSPSNDKSLFGINQDAWILNGHGSLDTESHGWRSQLMFFGDIRVNIGGESMTLLDYFSKKAIENGGAFDPALGWGTEVGSQEFADQVEDSILGQRLYLSALLKHGFWHFMDNKDRNIENSKRIKTQLWQKVAIFDPMGISNLNPGTLRNLTPNELQIWNRLSNGVDGSPSKLGIAALIRLRKEGARYWREQRDEHGNIKRVRVEKTDVELHREREDLLQALGGNNDEYKYQIVGDDGYFGEEYGNPLNADERAVVKKMIDAGIAAGPLLTESKLPYAFLINDAPHVAWEKTGDGDAGLGDENLFRILLSDQAHLVEGYSEMNSLVENPTAGAVGRFVKAVEAISLVVGRDAAQKRMEPFEVAYVDMARERKGTAYVGPIRNALKGVPLLRNLPFFRQGNSEMEKYWQSSGISFDEEDRAAFFNGLAARGAISNDISKGVLASQLNRLKRENMADSKANLMKMLKILSLILPAAIIYQLFKTVINKDMLADMGVEA